MTDFEPTGASEPGPGSFGQDLLDDQLLAAVAAVLEAEDPVPPAMVDAARAAFTWRTIDAELFDLLYDSARDGALTAVRAPSHAEQPPRLLTLSSPALTLEIEVEADEPTIVRGMVHPANGCTVELSQRSGSTTAAELSADGMFEVRLPDQLPFRLTVTSTATGLKTVTPWIDR